MPTAGLPLWYDQLLMEAWLLPYCVTPKITLDQFNTFLKKKGYLL